MNRRLQRVFAVVAVVFAAIQAIPVSRANPGTVAGNTLSSVANPPTEVRALLDRCCADCHSHETRWPWYSKVAPVSWLVAGHVNDGRDRLNLSTWAEAGAIKQRVQLEGMADAVDQGHMPPASYLWLHRDASLGPAEKTALTTWLRSAAARVQRTR